MKTLVIILAETRCHELTFNNFKKNVINELNADLCLCIGVKPDYDYNNPFYKFNKNSISVNWSTASPGLITNGVSVTYSSPAPANCPATPVNLNVLIYQVVPTITALGPFCESDPCVTLVGSPIGGTWSGTGVVGNQFCPDNVTNGTNATSTVTYTVGSAGCTFSTSVVVPVYGTPTLSPIQHN
jgi:hypothetical protein